MATSQDNDHFIKWRCLVALAHADGKVTAEEKSILEKQLEKAALTDAEREVLAADLQTPQDAAALFSRISSERERTDLIHRAHLLFWSDGEFPESERKIFELIKQQARSGYAKPVSRDVTAKRPLAPRDYFIALVLKVPGWLKQFRIKRKADP